MSGMKEYNKGYQSGYGMGPSRIPKTFAESVGHDAGKAQRDRERGMHQSSGQGGADAGVSSGTARVLLIIAAVLVLGMALVLLGPVLIKLFYPTAAIVGLVLTPRVKRTLGVGTPIYIGALIGMLLGCIDLALSSPQLNLYNLWMFIFVGAMLGSIGVPIALLRQKK